MKVDTARLERRLQAGMSRGLLCEVPAPAAELLTRPQLWYQSRLPVWLIAD